MSEDEVPKAVGKRSPKDIEESGRACVPLGGLHCGPGNNVGHFLVLGVAGHGRQRVEYGRGQRLPPDVESERR